MRARVVAAIDAIPASAWNALAPGAPPFVRHEFLAALEHGNSVGPGTGWTPAHVVVEQPSGLLVGALPLYVKSHSWGEFVFDFSWAQAYARHGLAYYPKLVAGIPFTPATSPKFLTHPDADGDAVAQALLHGARGLARDLHASSLHVLFADATDRVRLLAAGLVGRLDCQFHWHNAGFANFDDYLATFTADKRKKAKRERRRVAEDGIAFVDLDGTALLAGPLDRVYDFHADTFARHGHLPYLTRATFRQLAAKLPQALLVKLALRDDAPVAAAVCYRGDQALYGRYWGAAGDFHSLHFEACYHQGIDYCIRHGLEVFEPGTQGEHKLARGFAPTATWSLHEVYDQRFERAIAAFCAEEAAAVRDYMSVASEHVPFRRPVAPAALTSDVGHQVAQDL